MKLLPRFTLTRDSVPSTERKSPTAGLSDLSTEPKTGTSLKGNLHLISTPNLQRTFERVVRMPIKKAGVQDRIERALEEELQRRKAA